MALRMQIDGNVRLSYLHEADADSRKILVGSPPFLWRLSRSRKRRAVRRGLRSVLLAYCPDLLEQFERATVARVNWVRTYGNGLDRWFDGSRTDEEIAELVKQMNDTERGLRDVAVQLREFIMASFPIQNLSYIPPGI